MTISLFCSCCTKRPTRALNILTVSLKMFRCHKQTVTIGFMEAGASALLVVEEVSPGSLTLFYNSSFITYDSFKILPGVFKILLICIFLC